MDHGLKQNTKTDFLITVFILNVFFFSRIGGTHLPPSFTNTHSTNRQPMAMLFIFYRSTLSAVNNRSTHIYPWPSSSFRL